MNKFVLESEYLEIIIELISKKYNINSLIKIVVIAFCVRNGKTILFRNRKKNLVDVFFSRLNIRLLSHPEEVKAIFEVIHKLKSTGWIKIENKKVKVLKKIEASKCNNEFLNFFCEKNLNPISEVNKLDDKAFAEELIRHV